MGIPMSVKHDFLRLIPVASTPTSRRVQKELLIFSVLDRAIPGRRGVSPYGSRTVTDGSRGIPATFYEV